MTDTTDRPPPPADLVEAVRRARDAVNHGRHVGPTEWHEALADELVQRGLGIINSPVESEALQLRRALLRQGIVVLPEAIAGMLSAGVRPTRQLPRWFARVEGDDAQLCDDDGVHLTVPSTTQRLVLLHRCARLLNEHGAGPHLEDTPDA